MENNLGVKFLDYQRLENTKNTLFKIQFYSKFPCINYDSNSNLNLSNLKGLNPTNILIYSISEYNYSEYTKNGEDYLEFYINKRRNTLNKSQLNVVKKSIRNDLLEIFSTDIKFIWKKLYQSYIKSIKESKTNLELYKSLLENSSKTDYISICNRDVDVTEINEKNKKSEFKFSFKKVKLNLLENILSHLFDNDLSSISKQNDSIFSKKLKKYENKLNEYIIKNKITLTYLKWSSKEINNKNHIPSKKVITFDDIEFKNGCLIGSYVNPFTMNKVTKTFLCNYSWKTKAEYSKSIFFEYIEGIPESKSDGDNILLECLIFNFIYLDKNKQSKLIDDMEKAMEIDYNVKIKKIERELKILENDVFFYKKFR